MNIRRLAAVIAATVLTALTVTAAPAAHADVTTDAACDGTEGVTVVIDFGYFGGDVETACAVGDPATGLEAITDAGFTYEFVPNQPGFICRIDDLPDPCPGIPPVTQYWSYWHAEPGGEWEYSQLGAGSYDPEPGNAEGWSFGAGEPPTVAPPG